MVWWPQIQTNIQEVLQSCLLSAQLRPGQKPAIPDGTLSVTAPHDIIALDYMGPFMHAHKRLYILTMIDHFTRYAVVVPTHSCTAMETWTSFQVRWISYFGAPARSLTDNGSSFQGVFQTRCDDMNIAHICCSPYYPQGNGICEAFHKYLRYAMFSLSLGKTEKTIEGAISMAITAYTVTPHPSTHESP